MAHTRSRLRQSRTHHHHHYYHSNCYHHSSPTMGEVHPQPTREQVDDRVEDARARGNGFTSKHVRIRHELSNLQQQLGNTGGGDKDKNGVCGGAREAKPTRAANHEKNKKTSLQHRIKNDERQLSPKKKHLLAMSCPARRHSPLRVTRSYFLCIFIIFSHTRLERTCGCRRVSS